MRTETDNTDQTTADHLDHALADLTQASQQTGAETKAVIDSAVQQTRDALRDLTEDVGGRAKQLRTKNRDQTLDLKRRLLYAGDDVRLEVAIEAVRAQRTSLALDALSSEIKRCKRDLPWGA